jgi:hypothetical protein
MGSATSPKSARRNTSGYMPRGFAYATPYVLVRGLPSPRLAYPSPSPHRSNVCWWYRNINLLSIDYAFRPRLRSRLTLSGLTFPRKP